MSMDGQGTKRQRKIAENFNQLSRAHQRYRQTDRRQRDGTTIAYSELEHKFTFAKNHRKKYKYASLIYRVANTSSYDGVQGTVLHVLILRRIMLQIS